MISTNKKLKVTDLNPFLICVLCKGYYIDATTIVECLHSFCKSCIVKYLKRHKYCPICDVLVYKTKPLQNIRSDQRLQNVVYKLIPGLYEREMQRRQLFFSSTLPESSLNLTGEEKGIITESSEIILPDENISITLEYLANSADDFNKAIYGRRYLRCKASAPVSILDKFLRSKFNLSNKHCVELVCNNEPLTGSMSVMDVAYIYQWKKQTPMYLGYRILETKIKRICDKEEEENSKRLKLSEEVSSENAPVPDCSVKSSGDEPGIVTNPSAPVKRDISCHALNNRTFSVNRPLQSNEWKEVELKINDNGEMSATPITSQSSLLNLTSQAKPFAPVNTLSSISVGNHLSPITPAQLNNFLATTTTIASLMPRPSYVPLESKMSSQGSKYEITVNAVALGQSGVGSHIVGTSGGVKALQTGNAIGTVNNSLGFYTVGGINSLGSNTGGKTLQQAGSNTAGVSTSVTWNNMGNVSLSGNNAVVNTCVTVNTSTPVNYSVVNTSQAGNNMIVNSSSAGNNLLGNFLVPRSNSVGVSTSGNTIGINSSVGGNNMVGVNTSVGVSSSMGANISVTGIHTMAGIGTLAGNSSTGGMHSVGGSTSASGNVIVGVNTSLAGINTVAGNTPGATRSLAGTSSVNSAVVSNRAFVYPMVQETRASPSLRPSPSPPAAYTPRVSRPRGPSQPRYKTLKTGVQPWNPTVSRSKVSVGSCDPLKPQETVSKIFKSRNTKFSSPSPPTTMSKAAPTLDTPKPRPTNAMVTKVDPRTLSPIVPVSSTASSKSDSPTYISSPSSPSHLSSDKHKYPRPNPFLHPSFFYPGFLPYSPDTNPLLPNSHPDFLKAMTALYQQNPAFHSSLPPSISTLFNHHLPSQNDKKTSGSSSPRSPASRSSPLSSSSELPRSSPNHNYSLSNLPSSISVSPTTSNHHLPPSIKSYIPLNSISNSKAVSSVNKSFSPVKSASPSGKDKSPTSINSIFSPANMIASSSTSSKSYSPSSLPPVSSVASVSSAVSVASQQPLSLVTTPSVTPSTKVNDTKKDSTKESNRESIEPKVTPVVSSSQTNSTTTSNSIPSSKAAAVCTTNTTSTVSTTKTTTNSENIVKKSLTEVKKVDLSADKTEKLCDSKKEPCESPKNILTNGDNNNHVKTPSSIANAE